MSLNDTSASSSGAKNRRNTRIIGSFLLLLVGTAAVFCFLKNSSESSVPKKIPSRQLSVLDQSHRSLQGGLRGGGNDEDLTLEQRQAISRAVLSVLRSPQNEIDPETMDAAIKLGIPKETIMRAAQMAVERSGKGNKSMAKDPRTVQIKEEVYEQGREESSTFQQQAEAVQLQNAAPQGASSSHSFISDSAGMPGSANRYVGREGNSNIAANDKSQVAPEGQIAEEPPQQQRFPPTPPQHVQQVGTPPQKNQQVATPSGNGKRRKFVEYISSEWEQMWLDNVDRWGKEQSICDNLLDNKQLKMVHDYLEVMCNIHLPSPYENWCVIDDGDIQLFYNTDKRKVGLEFSWERPKAIPVDLELPPPQPLVPPPGKFDHILSRMVYVDEQTGRQFTEYIEPLVSHLRFPIAKCFAEEKEEYAWHDTIFKGFVIPPPPVVEGEKAIFYDAGSSNWIKGPRFFINTWLRHGILFDDVYSWDEASTAEQFYETVPTEFHQAIKYQRGMLSPVPEEDQPGHPFVPKHIVDEVKENDYVMFKLDIDRPKIEMNVINYILQDDFPAHLIDEMFWEHHISENYLMFEHWKATAAPNTTFKQSYNIFLKLRQKGIRAHSWM